jgi:hypothetical protein
MVHNREGFENSRITEKEIAEALPSISAHQLDVLSNQLLILIEGAYSTAGILGERECSEGYRQSGRSPDRRNR